MKEKFTLEKWLQNKSLKAVDQQGREVPIKQWPLEDLMNPPAELYLIDEEEEFDDFEKLYLKFVREHVEAFQHPAHKSYSRSKQIEDFKAEAQALVQMALRMYTDCKN